jgi:hypothetical protein
MDYTPVRVDKNTGNVWKWQRNSDDTVAVVPEHLWKHKDDWSEEEIFVLFEGTSIEVQVKASESEYTPSEDDDENFNPNIDDDTEETWFPTTPTT